MKRKNDIDKKKYGLLIKTITKNDKIRIKMNNC